MHPWSSGPSMDVLSGWMHRRKSQHKTQKSNRCACSSGPVDDDDCVTSAHGADLVIPSHASARYVERRSRRCSINLPSRQPPSASRRTRCPKIHGNGTPPPPSAARARPDDADRRRRGEGAQGRRRKKRIERRPSRPGGRRGGSFFFPPL
jgi:hypothetical protein